MKIAIRDGRSDRRIEADGRGTVLAIIDHPDFLNVGDKIRMYGTDVVVIGSEEMLGFDACSQVVYVGILPSVAQPDPGT